MLVLYVRARVLSMFSKKTVHIRAKHYLVVLAHARNIKSQLEIGNFSQNPQEFLQIFAFFMLLNLYKMRYEFFLILESYKKLDTMTFIVYET